MEPIATVTTGGVITVNADQVMHETGNVFLNFLQTGDNFKNLLIILAAVIVSGLIKLLIRRMDAKRRHKQWETKERERANIWKEECK